jgi:hypothetical protein
VLRRLALIAFLLGGCAGDPEETEPECIDVSTECGPLLPPTFENVYTNVLLPTCGSEDGSCHGNNARQGGLVLRDPDESYALLRGELDGRARVKPFDASCSKLVVRTHSIGKPWQMPPGEPIIPQRRCMIAQWVQNGALRDEAR